MQESEIDDLPKEIGLQAENNKNQQLSIEQIKSQVIELLRQLDESIKVKKENSLISLFFPEENDRNEYYFHTNNIYEIGQKLLTEENPEHYIDLAKNLSALARMFKFKAKSISSEEVADRKQQREYLYNAAVMYNAAIVIAGKKNVNSQDITDIVKEYESLEIFLLLNVIGVENTLIINKNYKEKLDQIASEAVNLFDEKIDADSTLVDGTEGYIRRADLINDFYKQISINLKSILRDMWEDSIEQMNVPAPKHAVILFGSLAKGTATHYSDIEFGVLIQNEEDKEYFHNVATLMALKVISIGQTSVSRELLKNEDGLWMNLDKLIIPGFQFDLGGKTPLNRKRLEDYVDETGRVIYPAGDDTYDLVETPQEMSKYVRDEYFDRDKLLPIELVNFERLYGENHLVEEYKNAIWNYLDEMTQDGNSRYENRAIQILAKNSGSKLSDIEKYKPQLGTAYEGLLLNVKQDIYRLPESLIEGIRIFYGGEYNTPMEFLDSITSEEAENKVFSKEAQENLKIMYAIATEFRLRIYVDNQGQADSFVMLHAIENNRQKYYTSIYDSDKYEILLRYYRTAIPFHATMKEWAHANQNKDNILKVATFFDSSDKVRGMVYMRSAQYEEAVVCFKKSIQKDANDREVNILLGTAYNRLDRLDDIRDLFPSDDIRVVDEYSALEAQYIAFYYYKNKPKQAIYQLEKILTYLNTRKDMLNVLADIQDCVGVIETLIGNPIGALYYFQKSIENRNGYYDVSHYKIANSLDNIGSMCSWSLEKHDLAITFHDRASLMYMAYYGSELHFNVAMAMNNKASACFRKGEFEQAKFLYEKSLEIRLQVFNNKPHLDIAMSYNNLAEVALELKIEGKALEYCEKSNFIYKVIYQGKTPGYDMIENIYIFARCFLVNKDYQHAIEKMEEAYYLFLKMYDETHHMVIKYKQELINILKNSINNSNDNMNIEKYKYMLQELETKQSSSYDAEQMTEKNKFIDEQEVFEADGQEISTIINLLLDNQEKASSSSTSSSQNQQISDDKILESIDSLKDFISETELSQNPGFYQYAFNAVSNNRFAGAAKQVIHLADNLREYLLHLLESNHVYHDFGINNNEKAISIYEQLGYLLEFMTSGQRFIGFVPRYPDFDPDDYSGGGDSGDGNVGNNNNDNNLGASTLLPLGSISNTNSTDI